MHRIPLKDTRLCNRFKIKSTVSRRRSRITTFNFGIHSEAEELVTTENWRAEEVWEYNIVLEESVYSWRGPDKITADIVAGSK